MEWTCCPSCGSKYITYNPGLSAVITITDPCWCCHDCGLYEYLYLGDKSSHYKGRYDAEGYFTGLMNVEFDEPGVLWE